MSKEIVRVFIKRFVDSITNERSEFPLKGLFLKIKDDLKNISLKDQEDIVRESVLDLEDLLSECQAMSKKRELKPMKCYSPSERFHIIKTSIQLKKIRNRLQGLLKQKPDCDIQPETILQGTPREYQWTYGSVDTSKIYGWVERVEEINKALLKEDNVGLNLVGIVGNLGTGKTALAQKVFMSAAVMDAFCLRLWVCVSPDCGLKELVWRMLDNLGVEDVESILKENKDNKDEVGVLLFILYVQLMKKRYLIVFDDVCECEKNDWHTNLDSEPPENSEWIGRLAFGLPKGNGSSIIVTSRFHQVAKNIVGRMNIYYPARMPQENAWLLFKTGYEDVHKPFDKSFESLKTEITEKCDGVPLALYTSGKELAQQKLAQQKGGSESVADTDNPQAEGKGGSQSGDTDQSIVVGINKEDTDDIHKQEIDSAGNTNQRDNDNAEPKEENTRESKLLQDGKAESRPAASNKPMSVGANKDTTQDDTTNKEEGINDTNKTAA